MLPDLAGLKFSTHIEPTILESQLEQAEYSSEAKF